MGRSLAVDGKHPQATAEFQRVLETYPKSPEVPEAMWLLGQSFIELKFCSDARVLLQDLTKRYPKSPRVSEAKQRMRELQKIVRDKRLCTS
jgi:TolA-binding protein